MTGSSVAARALVGAISIIAIVTAGVLASPTSMLESADSVSTDPVVFGLLVIGLYLVRPLFVLPTTPLAIVVGYGYGISVGVPVALVGVAITVTPVFFGARWLAGTESDPSAGGSTPDRPSTDHSSDDAGTTVPSGPIATVFSEFRDRVLVRSRSVVSRYYETAGPIRGVVASRLVPIPSDISTCAAAVSGVKYHQFVLGTLVGELPWTVAAVVVGASAATITTAGLGELSLTLTVACVLAAAVLLAGPIYRLVQTRLRTRPAGKPTDR
ncbi:TVP38/TMEM64 family protein [Natronorubrum daqingense]|uniref:TVP38/TMEM64 family protein n=1 Tax=Natronorubrum daqingense TaxID=588898 RepID=A0A1N7DYH4_9EURY|nr:VTT domain-containing protein [Natronorubrum daqingense]APX96247.1 TVP38/TMEM64 family protein [Natronorubrum daqingense]SIR80848.1 Uncharacterized membrane protein YdjX, TVP38/TMEM64 family, SNARE-associated domain [Natronorubrum daqingense]